MKYIIGKKIGMTQIFREDGTVVPVTRVQAGPCVVTQVKTAEKEGTNAVQIGFGVQKLFRLTKPEKGHLKDIIVHDNANQTVRHLHDFRNDNDLKRGDVFTVSIFEPGEKVKVVGKSKGRGFQGVVKRHGFKGSPASHGHKDQLRMPGSIGATDAARVFKGTRMGGHMGDAQISVLNLEIVKIDEENNELFIKGAVPGARNGILYVMTSQGSIEPKKSAQGGSALGGEVTEEELPEVPVDTEKTEDNKEEVKEEKNEASEVAETSVEETTSEEKKEDKKEETK